ncbi:MAG: hypothetical protein K6F93_07050 [Lachnospiraceae bacterium]|nr:hypothetical protein [Lachnospiraceae bacterium]
MDSNTNENNGQGRSKAVRIAALLGVVAIVGLIVAAAVVAVIGGENSGKIVIGLISLSFFIGVMVYLGGLFTKLKNKKKNGEL